MRTILLSAESAGIYDADARFCLFYRGLSAEGPPCHSRICFEGFRILAARR